MSHVIRGATAFGIATGVFLSGLGCGVRPAGAEPQQQPSRTSQAQDQEAPKMGTFKRPSDDELRDRLSPEQFRVTQRDGTEPPFRNAYWDEHRAGIYVDVVSGEPLFSSLDKFDSGTGWPSFTRPIEPAGVDTRTDRSLVFARTEVRSRLAGSHLGHVFEDGPPPTGLRYCINSAALRFVPVERLAEEGYGRFLPVFEASGERSASRAGGTSP
ncbi:methionine-R-sulfoxide reductase [Anaeromyxobacter sp. Fw109-5]|nr:peptide-methionine (R)-S-oxide reductase MsrB [Anaeromyxobacter sp. Fw109-5]ABS27807.1 methionine-R-sulfoxide reductase [Anaeromyxobacter sp. Fw109-5]